MIDRELSLLKRGVFLVSAQSNWYVRFGCLAPIIAIASLIYFVNRDSVLSGFLFFGLFFGFAVLFLMLSTKAEEKSKEKQKVHINSYAPKNGYTESHAFISYDLLSKIAVDEKKKRIHFLEPGKLDGKQVKKAYLHMPYVQSDYSYRQLLAVEVFINGTREETIVRDSPGTLERIEELGQSVDQIITNKIPLVRKMINRKIATVEMKLLIDDEEKPYRIIRFYNNLDKRIKRNSKDFSQVKDDVEHWVSLLTFIMNQR